MDLFYSFGYLLGTVIGIAILALPIAIVVLIIRKIRKPKNTQANVSNAGTAQSNQGKPVYSPPTTSESKATRKQEKASLKQAEKQAKLAQKQKENLLQQRIAELNAQYPVNRDFYNPTISYTCKRRNEFENIEVEAVAMEYIRSHPEAITAYEKVQTNIKNQYRYEKAFEQEIEPNTNNSRILKQKKRKYVKGTSSLIIISFFYKDKISGKRKEDRKVESLILDSLIRDVKNGVVRESEKKRFAKEQRSAMTPSLRYDVLQRDGFRCQICGATQEDGVKLHVDHIIPVSKGGKTEMSNLRTLCDRCNIGKGAKIEDSAHANRVMGATISAIHHNL